MSKKYEKKNWYQHLASRQRIAMSAIPNEPGSRGKQTLQDDFRCLYCGSYENLRGHVNSEKSSEIFYLCSLCCSKLHG